MDDVGDTFERFDADGDGEMNAVELRAALNALDLRTDEAQAVAVLQKYDADRSQRIEMGEFRTLVSDLRAFHAAASHSCGSSAYTAAARCGSSGYTAAARCGSSAYTAVACTDRASADDGGKVSADDGGSPSAAMGRSAELASMQAQLDSCHAMLAASRRRGELWAVRVLQLTVRVRLAVRNAERTSAAATHCEAAAGERERALIVEIEQLREALGAAEGEALLSSETQRALEGATRAREEAQREAESARVAASHAAVMELQRAVEGVRAECARELEACRVLAEAKLTSSVRETLSQARTHADAAAEAARGREAELRAEILTLQRAVTSARAEGDQRGAAHDEAAVAAAAAAAAAARRREAALEAQMKELNYEVGELKRAYAAAKAEGDRAARETMEAARRREEAAREAAEAMRRREEEACEAAEMARRREECMRLEIAELKRVVASAHAEGRQRGVQV